jgi:3-dehydroquinate dehydratase I
LSERRKQIAEEGAKDHRPLPPPPHPLPQSLIREFSLGKASESPPSPNPLKGWEGGVGGGQGTAFPGPPPATSLRVCVPVVEARVPRARSRYLRAARKGLWAEVRLDYLEKPDLKRLFRSLPGPVIATNRPRAEGGRWSGSEADRRGLLAEALTWGVHALDVEFSTEAAWRRELYARRGQTRLILSWHDFEGTPEAAALEEIFSDMLAQEADILKLVTHACNPADNLRVLALIPRALAAGKDIIAFCMGPLGKWSRVAAAFLGSFVTFAPFNPQQASAPGQITVNEMRRIWRMLKK